MDPQAPVQSASQDKDPRGSKRLGRLAITLDDVESLMNRLPSARLYSCARYRRKDADEPLNGVEDIKKLPRLGQATIKITDNDAYKVTLGRKRATWEGRGDTIDTVLQWAHGVRRGHRILTLMVGTVLFLISACAAGFLGMILTFFAKPDAADNTAWEMAAVFAVVVNGILLTTYFVRRRIVVIKPVTHSRHREERIESSREKRKLIVTIAVGIITAIFGSSS